MVLRPLQLLVSIRFQILFHRPPGLLFSFPSLYLFTIGQKKYLVLPHRRGCFQRGYSSLVVLWIRNTDEMRQFRLRDYHPLWFHFPVDSTIGHRSSAETLGVRRSSPQHQLCDGPSPSRISAVKLASNSVYSLT